jgi:hypothetical protein
MDGNGLLGFLGFFLWILIWVFLFLGISMWITKMVSKRTWTVEYNGNMIRVENTWVRETLFVNAEIQDENIGFIASRSKLWGVLATGEEVKVSIGSIFNMHCNIFVAQRLIFKK